MLLLILFYSAFSSFQEWWTHLWLNEGFASWIEYLCVDHCFPEYDIWTQFVSADYTRAQELDALDNSHPIEVRFFLCSSHLPFFLSAGCEFFFLLRKENCAVIHNAKENLKLHSRFVAFPLLVFLIFQKWGFRVRWWLLQECSCSADLKWQSGCRFH